MAATITLRAGSQVHPEESEKTKEEKKAAKLAKIKCFNCGGKGHPARNCSGRAETQHVGYLEGFFEYQACDDCPTSIIRMADVEDMHAIMSRPIASNEHGP